MDSIRPYKDRNIQFDRYFKVNGWTIKVYKISSEAEFNHEEILNNYLLQIDQLLKRAESTGLPNYSVGFLIVHSGADKVWFLLNWWTDGVMIETILHSVEFDQPGKIDQLSARNLICVWELEVVAHERLTWIEYILKKAGKPDFNGYLDCTFTR